MKIETNRGELCGQVHVAGNTKCSTSLSSGGKVFRPAVVFFRLRSRSSLFLLPTHSSFARISNSIVLLFTHFSPAEVITQKPLVNYQTPFSFSETVVISERTSMPRENNLCGWSSATFQILTRALKHNGIF